MGLLQCVNKMERKFEPWKRTGRDHFKMVHTSNCSFKKKNFLTKFSKVANRITGDILKYLNLSANHFDLNGDCQRSLSFSAVLYILEIWS